VRESGGREASRPGKLRTLELKLERESGRHCGIYTNAGQVTVHGRGLRARATGTVRTRRREQKIL